MTQDSSAALDGRDHRLDRYLGPGRLVRRAAGARAQGQAQADSLVVLLDEGSQVHATTALAFPYRPVIGDQLLVIGDAFGFYVIGVLHGRGRSQLSQPEGISLSSENGRLRLVGDRGIAITGDRVRLQTGALKTLAHSAIQTFGKLEQHVREGSRVEAGEVDELSRGGWLVRARRAVVATLDKARINSTTVRLG